MNGTGLPSPRTTKHLKMLLSSGVMIQQIIHVPPPATFKKNCTYNKK